MRTDGTGDDRRHASFTLAAIRSASTSRTDRQYPSVPFAEKFVFVALIAIETAAAITAAAALARLPWQLL